MKLIVGLGNPEDKYSGTRHNLGFVVLDELAKKIDGGRMEDKSLKLEKKFKAEILQIHYELLLVKPVTYMNNSGLAVAALDHFYKIKPEDIIIVYDELDLPLGKIKVSTGGAAAGHHGVESIIEHLGTDKFIRVRCGIGPSVNAEKFVLSTFLPAEKHHVRRMIKEAVKMIEDMVYCKL